MNIDQRLEALTQTVELLAHAVNQHDKLITEIMEGTARLLHVAQVHEQRIERLERGQES
jgi:ABC-type transporter Mla subunit MlaD